MLIVCEMNKIRINNGIICCKHIPNVVVANCVSAAGRCGRCLFGSTSCTTPFRELRTPRHTPLPKLTPEFVALKNLNGNQSL